MSDDDEFKSLLDEEDTVYDFENFVKLEILEESDEPKVCSRKLDFQSSEDEKSDAKNGPNFEKLTKKLKKLGLG